MSGGCWALGLEPCWSPPPVTSHHTWGPVSDSPVSAMVPPTGTCSSGSPVKGVRAGRAVSRATPGVCTCDGAVRADPGLWDVEQDHPGATLHPRVRLRSSLLLEPLSRPPPPLDRHPEQEAPKGPQNETQQGQGRGPVGIAPVWA